MQTVPLRQHPHRELPVLADVRPIDEAPTGNCRGFGYRRNPPPPGFQPWGSFCEIPAHVLFDFSRTRTLENHRCLPPQNKIMNKCSLGEITDSRTSNQRPGFPDFNSWGGGK